MLRQCFNFAKLDLTVTMSPNLSHLFRLLKVNMLSLLRVIVDDEGSVSILVNTADLTPCHAVCR